MMSSRCSSVCPFKRRATFNRRPNTVPFMCRKFSICSGVEYTRVPSSLMIIMAICSTKLSERFCRSAASNSRKVIVHSYSGASTVSRFNAWAKFRFGSKDFMTIPLLKLRRAQDRAADLERERDVNRLVGFDVQGPTDHQCRKGKGEIGTRGNRQFEIADHAVGLVREHPLMGRISRNVVRGERDLGPVR